MDQGRLKVYLCFDAWIFRKEIKVCFVLGVPIEKNLCTRCNSDSVELNIWIKNNWKFVSVLTLEFFVLDLNFFASNVWIEKDWENLSDFVLIHSDRILWTRKITKIFGAGFILSHNGYLNCFEFSFELDSRIKKDWNFVLLWVSIQSDLDVWIKTGWKLFQIRVEFIRVRFSDWKEIKVCFVLGVPIKKHLCTRCNSDSVGLNIWIKNNWKFVSVLTLECFVLDLFASNVWIIKD